MYIKTLFKFCQYGRMERVAPFGYCPPSQKSLRASHSRFWLGAPKGTATQAFRTAFCKLVLKSFRLERVAGIEPASSAWKADVLPLYDTRKERRGRILRIGIKGKSFVALPFLATFRR
jgi:hypothetical protein